MTYLAQYEMFSAYGLIFLLVCFLNSGGRKKNKQTLDLLQTRTLEPDSFPPGGSLQYITTNILG